ncbi:MAG: type II toxin-antitoxin system prevent-host-death family antitoxin [Gammaproteobacteria bacterium]|nr:type II toxin-antitoxin system prevent-host-death family antitoxin [Gammaproteobacteria bacterium]MDD9799930.1 type II toxin-antitoxin system prevent-host-death family antitoxin [Gammaproteobacteria bacterium]MDD9851077.1 type II toxin-antitoxin system prevent-host-death family antitoxin [Gammaproteobacteria bacterium]MDD9871729.1 type II toxin-antitoxin system prevent-host-death family antitoxin [Gammaproteobacteria bacterium]
MITVNAQEAGIDFSLLEKVRKGEEVLITQQGKAVARLTLAGREERELKAKQARFDKTMRELRAFRKTVKLGGLNWKDLRDEGRR